MCEDDGAREWKMELHDMIVIDSIPHKIGPLTDHYPLKFYVYLILASRGIGCKESNLLCLRALT